VGLRRRRAGLRELRPAQPHLPPVRPKLPHTRTHMLWQKRRDYFVLPSTLVFWVAGLCRCVTIDDSAAISAVLGAAGTTASSLMPTRTTASPSLTPSVRPPQKNQTPLVADDVAVFVCRCGSLHCPVSLRGALVSGCGCGRVLFTGKEDPGFSLGRDGKPVKGGSYLRIRMKEVRAPQPQPHSRRDAGFC